jgi:ATP-dependent exoDNAse (exonuclease V) beta subunit
VTAIPGDQQVRSRIAQDLEANLMVVAGAGTGKTTALVGRIVHLVRSGGTPLREIAAITFTEASAAELRQQVRHAFTADGDGDGEGDRALTAARHEVDDAAIGTVHWFAQRILRDHFVDARVPPGFVVLDDTADIADFDARWSRFADALLDDPDAERALMLGFTLGLRHTDLSEVAWNLHGQWDRLEDGGLDYLRAARTCDALWPVADPAPVVAAIDRALAAIEWCTDDADKMVLHLRGAVSEARVLLSDASADSLAVLQILDTLPPLRSALGRQENWSGRIAEVRASCAGAEQARLDVLDGVRRAVLGDLLARLATFTLAAADERREEGRLTFHDLLVHARRLLRRGGDTLDTLRRRYSRLLIDEFQDTDPIQIELAARLASAVDGDDLGGARPGALFVVGDPLQSIYRFRRADIDLFDRVRSEMGSTVLLQSNFRSVPGIVDFVNVVFDEIFGRGSVPDQAPFHPLRAERPGPVGDERGHVMRGGTPAATGVVQLTFDGFDAPVTAVRAGRPRSKIPGRPPAPVVTVGGPLPVSTPEVRRRAAVDASGAIGHMVGRGWLVQDPDSGTRRPACWADIAVLIPARSSLSSLEEAFEDAGIPYRLEGAALLWGAEEVRDVLAVLRATDDPADAVAVLGALRSPGLACGDDDLVAWHTAGGTWDPRADAPAGLGDHPVAAAMDVLERLHRRRWWSEPSAMVAAALDELHSFDLALVHRRPRDHWHRLRWLQDQARLFDESPGGTMRDFLAWAERRAEGDGRMGGVGPPDPDDDAVRVMTIHGAKGLEFPIVVLAGLERDQADAPRPPAVVWTENDVPEVHVGPFRTAGFEQAGLREQYLDVLEQHRLLYVGMTRARDHLVLCLHHKQRNGGSDSSLAALVTRICADNPSLWRPLPGVTPDSAGRERVPDRVASGAPLPVGWREDRQLLLDRLRRRPVTTATAVAHAAGAPERWSAPEPSIGPADGDRPGSPMSDGREGEVARRIGRAVHDTLADLDLTTHRDAAGRPAGEVARARALAQGVPAHATAVAVMVDAALASTTVARAATRRHWREVHVAAPVGDGGLLEGFVDLLFEDDGTLVVVDYKTDRLTGGHPPAAAITAHRLQLAAYAVALESSTGLRVGRCVMVFVGDGTPVEHVIDGDDLGAAQDEALMSAVTLVSS